MCRYQGCPYKGHWACFSCRKQFKDYDRKTPNSGKCPQCGEMMTQMGLDFKPPLKSKIKEWNLLKEMAESGKTFGSCGCTGPGYGLIDSVNPRFAKKHKRKGLWEK